jgi:hypothetical protein
MWKSWQVDGDGGLEMPVFGAVVDAQSSMGKMEPVSLWRYVMVAQVKDRWGSVSLIEDAARSLASQAHICNKHY